MLLTIESTAATGVDAPVTTDAMVLIVVITAAAADTTTDGEPRFQRDRCASEFFCCCV
jgi:hypothetical protein